ncbi:MAG: hypothetical protein LBT59_23835 [Clostridiales bacterium]|jgi:hypothetical protein|nr:hypothetical protein [Clostridiales bacterium]
MHQTLKNVIIASELVIALALIVVFIVIFLGTFNSRSANSNDKSDTETSDDLDYELKSILTQTPKPDSSATPLRLAPTANPTPSLTPMPTATPSPSMDPVIASEVQRIEKIKESNSSKINVGSSIVKEFYYRSYSYEYNNQIIRFEESSGNDANTFKRVYDLENSQLVAATYESDQKDYLYFKNNKLIYWKSIDSFGIVREVFSGDNDLQFSSNELYAVDRVDAFFEYISNTEDKNSEMDAVNSQYKNYIYGYVNALNSRNFDYLSPYLLADTQIYNEQKRYITDYMVNKKPNLTEELLSYAILSVVFLSDEKCELTASETYKIINPDSTSTVVQSSTYTLVLNSSGKWLFSELRIN